MLYTWLLHQGNAVLEMTVKDSLLLYFFKALCLCVCVHVESFQSCPTLCDPTDSSPQGSSAHGFLQARILEWVATPFSRGSSLLRDWTWVSCIAGRFFTI